MMIKSIFKQTSAVVLMFCAAIFTSCNMIDVSGVGYEASDNMKPTDVRDFIFNTTNGNWKAEYQGHEFFFQFKKDGTAGYNSDFLISPSSGTTEFARKGRQVEVTFNGVETHFAKLGSQFIDTKFIATSFDESTKKITLQGETSGNELVLDGTTADYISRKVASKADFNDLFAKNLLDNQALFDSDGKLIAYYTLGLNSVSDLSITLLTIEKRDGNDVNGHVKTYESKLTKDGKVFKLANPFAIKAVNGTTYNFDALDLTGDAVKVSGISGLTIRSNKGSVNYWDDLDKKPNYCCKHVLENRQEPACDEISNEINMEWLNEQYYRIAIEAFGGYGDDNMKKSRPIVFWFIANNSNYVTLAFPGSQPGASVKVDGTDRVVFDGSIPPAPGYGYSEGFWPADRIKEVREKYANILKLWYEPKGMYIIETPDQRHAYLLSSGSDGLWMRMVRK